MRTRDIREKALKERRTKEDEMIMEKDEKLIIAAGIKGSHLKPVGRCPRSNPRLNSRTADTH